MNRDIRQKNKMTFVLIFILLLFVGAIISYQHTMLKNKFNKDIAKIDKNINDLFETLFHDIKIKIYVESESISKDKKVIEAMRRGDRESLYKRVEPIYKRLNFENSHMKIMTFRDRDGVVLLRAHKPSLYGDMIKDSRVLIMDVNKYKKQLSGFEAGKLNMTYRLATPIFYNETYIGSMEIGVEPEYMTNIMNKVFGIKEALFVKDSSGKYVFVRGDELLKSNMVNFDSEKSFDMTVNAVRYKVNPTLDLLDHNGNVYAKLLIAHDVNDKLDEIESMINNVILRAVLYMLIVFIILQYYMRYFLHKTESLNSKLIKQSKELEEINKTLSHKVSKEVEVNREKDRKMLQQSRLAQMGEMLSMIAHQWRQPLGAISATSLNLRMEMELDKFKFNTKEQVEYYKQGLYSSLSDIDAYIQTLSSTIDDFKNFYKPNKKTVKTDINDPIKSSLKMIARSLHSDGIEIMEDYRSKKKLDIYDTELMQVFLNIFLNAKDNFIEKNMEEKHILIKTEDIDKGVKVSIYDNGGGIPDDAIDFVFDPYFSTKLNKNGTGLGLYMSKIIVEEHHDAIITASNYEFGAVFTIVFNSESK